MSDYTTEAEVSVNARKKRRQLDRARGRRARPVLRVLVRVVLLPGRQLGARPHGHRPPPARPTTPRPSPPRTPGSTSSTPPTASGLAGSVARSLGERGFVIGKVANDPSSRKAPKVAEIRYGAKGAAQAKLLRTSLPKGTALVKDKRKVVTVDLALGPKYTAPRPRAHHDGDADVPRAVRVLTGADDRPVGLGADAEARKAAPGHARPDVARHPRRSSSSPPSASTTGAPTRRCLLESRAMPHLHQTRVGIRRLRSSFSLFRPLLRDVAGGLRRGPPAAHARPAVRPRPRPRRAAHRPPRRRPRPRPGAPPRGGSRGGLRRVLARSCARREWADAVRSPSTRSSPARRGRASTTRP